jgi:hypothetical protein
MPKGHSSRWCKYQITYDRPDGKTWDKTWAREVISDENINAFKRDCQNLFLAANEGVSLDDDNVFTSFHDGYQNQPDDTKAI